jgi:hypothetical protein
MTTNTLALVTKNGQGTPSGNWIGALGIACADVVIAKAKAAPAIALIIS